MRNQVLRISHSQKALRRATRGDSFGSTGISLSSVPAAFVLLCHTLALLAGAVFVISQIIFGGWIWAGFICVPMVFIHRILAYFGGWAASLLCFIAFVLMTFSMSGYHIRTNAVSEWVKQHPEVYQTLESKYDNHTTAALSFKHDLRTQWVNSQDQSWYSWHAAEGKVDTMKVFDAKWAEFEQWVGNGANGTPPIPTPQFLIKFLYSRSDAENIRDFGRN